MLRDVNNTFAKPHKKKFAKAGFGLIGIIIAIAVIAAMSAGGGLYWRESKKQQSILQTGVDAKKKAEELKAKIEEQQNEMAGQDIDTSNWKTYRNEKYGFEVRYPADWRLDIMDKHDNAGKVTLQSVFWLSDQALHRVLITPLGFGAFDAEKKDIVETKSLSVNDVAGRWREFGDAGGIYAVDVDQFFQKQYPSFEIVFIPVNARPYIDQVKISQFKTILGTFKFIEPQANIDTSVWKTYRNEKYGFEFKYPSSWRIEEIYPQNIETLRFVSEDSQEIPKLEIQIDYISLLSDISRFSQDPMFRPIMLGGRTAYQEKERVDKSPSSVAVKLDNETVLLFVSWDEDLNEIYDKILATFKFIK